MKPSSDWFDEARFDSLCARIRETGHATLASFPAGSDFDAADILAEAARVLGIAPKRYIIGPDPFGRLVFDMHLPQKH